MKANNSVRKATAVSRETPQPVIAWCLYMYKLDTPPAPPTLSYRNITVLALCNIKHVLMPVEKTTFIVSAEVKGSILLHIDNVKMIQENVEECQVTVYH